MNNKPDPFLERLKATAHARGRVAKIKALAEKHPDTPEGIAAAKKGRELATEHGISYDDLSVGVHPKKASLSGFGAFTSAIKSAFPGQDDEDYSKYAPKKKED